MNWLNSCRQNLTCDRSRRQPTRTMKVEAGVYRQLLGHWSKKSPQISKTSEEKFMSTMLLEAVNEASTSSRNCSPKERTETKHCIQPQSPGISHVSDNVFLGWESVFFCRTAPLKRHPSCSGLLPKTVPGAIPLGCSLNSKDQIYWLMSEDTFPECWERKVTILFFIHVMSGSNKILKHHRIFALQHKETELPHNVWFTIQYIKVSQEQIYRKCLGVLVFSSVPCCCWEKTSSVLLITTWNMALMTLMAQFLTNECTKGSGFDHFSNSYQVLIRPVGEATHFVSIYILMIGPGKVAKYMAC